MGNHKSGNAPVIAIDGPAASGKGTVARLLAKMLGFHVLESGMIYRSVALLALRRHIRLNDEDALIAIATELSDKTLYEDLIKDQAIEADDIATHASQIAAQPLVREVLIPVQRDRRLSPGLVAEGRDMGTVIFPDAVLKVYLTADIEERARRRAADLSAQGRDATMHNILSSLRARDLRDAGRSSAPMLKGADAIPLDTTGMTAEAVVQNIREWLRKAAKGIGSG